MFHCKVSPCFKKKKRNLNLTPHLDCHLDCHHVTVTFTLTVEIPSSIDVVKTCVKALIYPYHMVLIFLHHLIQLSLKIHMKYIFETADYVFS